MLNFCAPYNKHDRDDYLSRLIPLNVNEALESKSIEELIVKAIKHYKESLFGETPSDIEKFELFLGYLYQTRKGLTEDELSEIIEGITEEQILRFLSLFDILLIQHNNYIFIRNVAFRKAIKESLTYFHYSHLKSNLILYSKKL